MKIEMSSGKISDHYRVTGNASQGSLGKHTAGNFYHRVRAATSSKLSQPSGKHQGLSEIGRKWLCAIGSKAS